MKLAAVKAVTTEFPLLCDVTPYSLAEIHRSFGGSCCLQLQNKRVKIKSRDFFEMSLKYYQTARRHTLKESTKIILAVYFTDVVEGD
jgi:hypothetical protein